MAPTGESPAAPDPGIPPRAEFQLLWTVGFSGKRNLAPAREGTIRAALRQVVAELAASATARGARLTAVSSLARGADVFFAEAVQATPQPGGPLAWKCLLPFRWDDFIRHDLATEVGGAPLAETERAERRRRAEACLAQAITREVTSPAADSTDPEQREEAYLECGYRTADEADVMVFLLQQDEFEKLATAGATAPRAGCGAGTLAVAGYARAAGRPMILLNADADDVFGTRRMLSGAHGDRGLDEWFVDPIVSRIVAQAAGRLPEPSGLAREPAALLWGPLTPERESVARIGTQLGMLADHHQGRTHHGLRWVLHCHLAASAIAAIGATVLVVDRPEAIPAMWLAALALLALTKPGLAFMAWWLERRLHQYGDRESWLHARVLAELCRSAVATWPLPVQPLDAQDEEDFPTLKRLIRTLRLLREQDRAAALAGTVRRMHETQREADMRAACAIYGEQRLRDQVAYYGRRHRKGAAEERRWRLGFQAATWTAIVAGLALALDRVFLAAGDPWIGRMVERVLEAIIIIAPFVAAHCLSTMTILDTRRRCRRYAKLTSYLGHLADTLAQTEANPSRIRLIEHAERTLIEEQHEWFSVMRNLDL